MLKYSRAYRFLSKLDRIKRLTAKEVKRYAKELQKLGELKGGIQYGSQEAQRVFDKRLAYRMLNLMKHDQQKWLDPMMKN